MMNYKFYVEMKYKFIKICNWFNKLHYKDIKILQFLIQILKELFMLLEILEEKFNYSQKEK